MRIEECHFDGNVLLVRPKNMPRPEFVKWLLPTIPPAFVPKYFSRSELLRKHPEFELGNRKKLDHYLNTQSAYWFHTDSLEFMFGDVICDRYEVSVSGRSLSDGRRLLEGWIPVLDCGGLYYATGGTPAEFEHRNGWSLTYPDGKVGAHGWVGRDYDRYVPGLYWLNYFSGEFAERHAIGFRPMQEEIGAEVQALSAGWMVRLYDAPEHWTKFKNTVDDYLFQTAGFFSKRRVVAPVAVDTPREALDILVEIGRAWP